MNKIQIPTMLFWENGNTWYGSSGPARFFIRPVKQEPSSGLPAQTTLEVELWRGPFTKALSEILDTACFPLSEDGLVQVTDWLSSWAEKLNHPA